MKLLKMKLKENKCKDILVSPMQYFVKLETEAEVNHDIESKLGVTDDIVGYYLGLSEPEPAVGDYYTDADGLVWERVE